MSLTAPATGLPDPMLLSTITDDIAGGVNWVGGTGGSSSGGVVNQAVFVPVRLSGRHTYTKAWWFNGSTASGNIDVGIYTLSGTTLTRIVASTAEAQGTVSTVQVAATFTATTVGPGLFYLALSMSSATATVTRGSMGTSHMTKMHGLFQALTAHPLPSTCTAASPSNWTSVPAFGLCEYTL